ncbi:poly-(ADP-ribose) polymerase [Anticarsia gemmatalis]|uniref:poly-(ADP-ribose) polymerase n=1 Tax=Anticarsia gemmatalis TaxID=129554 RepID=UPI003F758E01
MTDLPFQAEYAKTGRASCKGCKQKIEQGTLRLAIMVQSAFFDGKQPNWHHEECFFKKKHPTTVTDIGNFNKLKTEDQKRIKSTMESSTGIVMPETKGKGKGSSKKRKAEESDVSAVKDFNIEYSKSSRATCKHCEIKICKDEVRVSKTVYDTDVGAKYGGQPLWHHVKCFAEARSELLFFAGGESLPGFKNLSKEDQAMVKKEIKPFKVDDIPVKKLKDEPKDAAELKEEKEKEKKIEKQNKLFHKHRQALSELKKTDLEELLEHNSQQVVPGKDECLDRVADMMAFGALEPCTECKNGQLVLDTTGYKCTGNLSEWTKCSAVTQTPSRVPMKIPSSYKDGSIFKKFKPKTDVRLFEAAPRPVMIVVKDEPSTSVKKELPIPPLKNLQFFLYGKLKDKEETKKRILKLGGLCVSKLTDTTVAVVSTKKEIQKMSPKMEEIQGMDIEVVEESFIDLIKKDGTITESLQLIKENNIAEWGSDPATRVPQDVKDGKSIPKSGSMYVKSDKSSSVKLKIKGGSAVDPASKLEDEAHVYKDDDNTYYTVVLSQTDVVAQKNSFYKMQVLQSNNKNKYWLFRSWGRIGTTIGGTKVESCSLYQAIHQFEKLYMERTDNPWHCRKNFVKVPGKYYPLDMDYGGDSETTAKLTIDKKCDLPEPVQKLIIKIFDVDVMKQTLLEFELDTEKMPLGKLSKKQIKSGYKVLSELLTLIEKGSGSQNKIIDATNRFFTLIPHDFGVKNAPLLDNLEIIQTKTAMLDNLLEIEIAYSLMKTESATEETSPITSHYLKLKADIAPLPTESPEFEMIKKYVRNTHASTHQYYTLDLQQVFKVVREGEEKRFKPFRKLHNRRLLWHGSRTTNFAGIISQGLRIAPPEAPVTGYMFGKGIYFADMVSKSANYCCTNKNNSVGLLLLCDVALGNMKECLRAEDVKLPPNMHSAWGLGSTQPDPAQNLTLEDGLIVPLGTPVQTNVQASLLYNEFIVYDVAQVNVKYLVQMKFNHSY